MPSVSANAIRAVPAVFVHDDGIEATHRAGLVLDDAGWYTSHSLVIPVGIDLIRLPSRSPEMQSAECLLPLVDALVANRTFVDLKAVRTK